ncbi:MAG: recombinase family protein [Phascolarctobacterium sp.]|nr:recombinase family protein [Phascolarctobacterium sp.]
MLYGYARVSTKKQVKGYSLKEQTDCLKNEGCELIVEEQFTGSTTQRPKFEQLINTLSAGDTLVVTKLDRFARNVTEGISIIRQLFKKNVKVYILNVGLLENTAMGNFFITTLLAVAELERAMIYERTLAGKEIARTKNGFKEGRPRIAEEKMELALTLKANRTYKQVENLTGISKSSIIRFKRLKQRQQLDE